MRANSPNSPAIRYITGIYIQFCTHVYIGHDCNTMYEETEDCSHLHILGQTIIIYPATKYLHSMEIRVGRWLHNIIYTMVKGCKNIKVDNIYSCFWTQIILCQCEQHNMQRIYTLFWSSTVFSTCTDEVDLAEQLLTVDGRAAAHNPGIGPSVLCIIGQFQCRAVGLGEGGLELLESTVHHFTAVLMEWKITTRCYTLTYKVKEWLHVL